MQNMKEPYIIFYTENVATQSLKSLHSLGIDTFPINEIDTPYRASHKGAKFQVHFRSLFLYVSRRY